MHKKKSAESLKIHLNDCMIINRAFGKDMMLTTQSSVLSCTEYLSKYKTTPL